VRTWLHAHTKSRSLLIPSRTVRATLALIENGALSVLVALILGLASSADAQAEADVATLPASIVFLAAPELPPTVRAGLFDALEAQLTGTGITLHWETMNSAGTDLRAAIGQGKPAAANHTAAGVFWLDVSGASDWLLYLMDAPAERILVRRMEGAAAAPSASIEAIAVIVRESSAALSAGRPIAMEALPPTTPVAVPTPAPTPPESPPTTAPVPVAPPAPTPAANVSTDTPGVLRFALAYAGSPLSKEVPWQSGLDFEVRLGARNGLFTGVAYTLLPSVTTRGEGFTLDLDRHPVRLLLGVGIAIGRALRLDADAAAILDVVTRTTVSAPTSGTANGDDSRVIFGGGLNVHLNWTPQPSLDLFATIGVEAFLNRFDYAIERNERRITLVSPWMVTPTAGVGVAFRP